MKPGHLVNEIKEIEGKVDSLTWDAIEAVRKVGNIGAHMEKDINLIVDVEPQEAALLIGLIETLIKDWYVAKEDRKRHLFEIAKLAETKKPKKDTSKVGAPPTVDVPAKPLGSSGTEGPPLES